jgi:hypothetical protein
VKSRTTRRFRQAYDSLPEEIRRRADRAYALFQRDPHHPSLRFKKIHQQEPVYAVRITRDYRALGVLEGDMVIWFWIGNHEEYERLIS